MISRSVIFYILREALKVVPIPYINRCQNYKRFLQRGQSSRGGRSVLVYRPCTWTVTASSLSSLTDSGSDRQSCKDLFFWRDDKWAHISIKKLNWQGQFCGLTLACISLPASIFSPSLSAFLCRSLSLSSCLSFSLSLCVSVSLLSFTPLFPSISSAFHTTWSRFSLIFPSVVSQLVKRSGCCQWWK